MGGSHGGEPNNEQNRPAEAADRPLSQGELESSLSDIRAEVYLIEAQRMETERLVASAESQEDAVERERLTHRLRRMAARLEELEAKTAGLRARLEQLPGARREGARREPRKRRDERRLKPGRRAR